MLIMDMQKNPAVIHKNCIQKRHILFRTKEDISRIISMMKASLTQKMRRVLPRWQRRTHLRHKKLK